MLILIALILVVLFSISTYKEEGLSESIFVFISSAAMAAVFICLSVLLEFNLRSASSDFSSEIHYKYGMVSLKDNSTISGTFFLGSGVLNGKLQYYCYMNSKNNTYKLRKFECSDSSIKEDSTITNTTAFVEQIDKYSSSYIVAYPFSPKGIVKTEYIFNVPKGTIIREIKLDTE